jgi:hypothetical protein
MEKGIKITIDDDGIKMEAIGFEGKGCHDAMTMIQSRLGKITELKQKPEFYQDRVEDGEQEQLGGC